MTVSLLSVSYVSSWDPAVRRQAASRIPVSRRICNGALCSDYIRQHVTW